MPEEKQIDWSKAPEGATHYCHETDDYMAAWFKRDKGGWYFCLTVSTKRWVPFWGDFPERMTITERQKPTPTWNGAGLPPVGTVCEYLDSSGSQWHRVTVLFSGIDLMVLRGLADGEEVEIPKFKYEDPRFRPIRTPEQIAAEEREAGIAAIKVIADAAIRRGESAAAAVYDAGYRLAKGEA